MVFRFDQYLHGLLWVLYVTMGVGTKEETVVITETCLCIGGLVFGLVMQVVAPFFPRYLGAGRRRRPRTRADLEAITTVP